MLINKKKYNIAIFIFIIIFLLCGLITSMNGILVTRLKYIFNLNYFESTFIQFCFFLSYFITSLIFYIINYKLKNSINKIKYKNIITTGLIIALLGSLLFYYIANMQSYYAFLTALFILASGITLLQIGVNPYITLLGNPKTASGRLNLAQAFNSLGSTIGPLIGGNVLLNNQKNHKYILNIPQQIKKIYSTISIILILIIIIIININLPDKIKRQQIYNKNKLLINKYKHLKYGIIAIFMYVGAEVAIDSLMIVFLENCKMNITQNVASKFVSLYWGGSMIGRFFGSVFLSNLNKKIKSIIIFLLLVLSLYYSNLVTKYNIEIRNYFWLLIFINVIAFIYGKNIPQKTLSIFSIIIIILLLIGSLLKTTYAISCIIGIGLFNSIMFPTIFSLAIKNLNKDTPTGSSLLIMSIVGGALIPIIQGKIADLTNVQISYLTPILCYAYLLFYGLTGYKVR